MTASQLIQQLKKYPHDMPVVIYDIDIDLFTTCIDIEQIVLQNVFSARGASLVYRNLKGEEKIESGTKVIMLEV